MAGSLTKRFWVPGVGIVYLLAHESMMKRLSATQMPWAISAFASAILSQLDNVDGYVKKSIAGNEKRRRVLRAALEDLGFLVYPSAANFLFVNTGPFGCSARKLADVLRKKHILIRDCSNYRDLDGYGMRIAVKNEESNRVLVEALWEMQSNRSAPLDGRKQRRI